MKKVRGIFALMGVIMVAIVLTGALLSGAACAEGVGVPEGLPGEFFDWESLGTYAGAAAIVALITQLTKGLPYIDKIPTQVWSYILSVVVLLASLIFTGNMTASNACLTLANGVLVSLASNGGYSLITRVKSEIL